MIPSRLFRDESGASTIEYGLIAGLSRLIDFYRRLLAIGASDELKQRYLSEITKAEEELVAIEKESQKHH